MKVYFSNIFDVSPDDIEQCLGSGLAIKHSQKDNGGHHTIWCHP
jgi:hypothetical protein